MGGSGRERGALFVLVGRVSVRFISLFGAFVFGCCAEVVAYLGFV